MLANVEDTDTDCLKITVERLLNQSLLRNLPKRSLFNLRAEGF